MILIITKMSSHQYSKPHCGEKTILWRLVSMMEPTSWQYHTPNWIRTQVIPDHKQLDDLVMSAFLSQYMGQVTKVGPSCHPGLLSNDSTTRQQDRHTTMTWSESCRDAHPAIPGSAACCHVRQRAAQLATTKPPPHPSYLSKRYMIK